MVKIVILIASKTRPDRDAEDEIFSAPLNEAFPSAARSSEAHRPLANRVDAGDKYDWPPGSGDSHSTSIGQQKLPYSSGGPGLI
jgi:hypothetical protein